MCTENTTQETIRIEKEELACLRLTSNLEDKKTEELVRNCMELIEEKEITPPDDPGSWDIELDDVEHVVAEIEKSLAMEGVLNQCILTDPNEIPKAKILRQKKENKKEELKAEKIAKQKQSKRKKIKENKKKRNSNKDNDPIACQSQEKNTPTEQENSKTDCQNQNVEKQPNDDRRKEKNAFFPRVRYQKKRYQRLIRMAIVENHGMYYKAMLFRYVLNGMIAFPVLFWVFNPLHIQAVAWSLISIIGILCTSFVLKRIFVPFVEVPINESVCIKKQNKQKVMKYKYTIKYNNDNEIATKTMVYSIQMEYIKNAFYDTRTRDLRLLGEFQECEYLETKNGKKISSGRTIDDCTIPNIFHGIDILDILNKECRNARKFMVNDQTPRFSNVA